MNNYDSIPLSETTLSHLYTLYKRVYGKDQSRGYYEAKYDTAYMGVQYLGFFAFLNKQPVAYYGVIPVRCSIDKQTVLGAQSCDTMTDPDHRKKGLFVELAQRTFELAKEKRVHFIFGFPNQNSYPGFIKKLGFLHQHTMESYTIRFRNTLYKKLFRKMVRTAFVKKGSLLQNVQLSEGFDGIIYDAPYVKYKTYSQGFILLAKGYSAWLHLSGGAWVGAVEPLGKEQVKDLMDQLENKLKCSSATFMISPGTELSLLLKNRTKQEGFAVITKNLSNTYALDRLKFQFADIDLF